MGAAVTLNPIEDFKLGGVNDESSERDGPRGHLRRHKVMSSCGESDSIPPIFSQERKNHKLMLNAEEPEDADMLELGIENAVAHHYGGAGSSDMEMETDEFHCLSKLKSRKSSPI